jgi:hypothetical protein
MTTSSLLSSSVIYPCRSLSPVSRSSFCLMTTSSQLSCSVIFPCRALSHVSRSSLLMTISTLLSSSVIYPCLSLSTVSRSSMFNDDIFLTLLRDILFMSSTCQLIFILFNDDIYFTLLLGYYSCRSLSPVSRSVVV